MPSPASSEPLLRAATGPSVPAEPGGDPQALTEHRPRHRDFLRGGVVGSSGPGSTVSSRSRASITLVCGSCSMRRALSTPKRPSRVAASSTASESVSKDLFMVPPRL